MAKSNPTEPRNQHGRPPTSLTQATSLRVTDENLKWIDEECAEQGGIARGAVINALLANQRTYFHSAPQDIGLFEAEAKALGLSRSDHLQYIVAEHRNKLMRSQFEEESLLSKKK